MEEVTKSNEKAVEEKKKKMQEENKKHLRTPAEAERDAELAKAKIEEGAAKSNK